MINIYEVGSVFPIKGESTAHDSCKAHIVGSSFDVMYFMANGKSKDRRIFKDSLLRFHVCVIESIPFLSISYLGSDWTYDFTINVVERDTDILEKFLTPGNTVTFFLVDAKSNILQAIRTIGLPEKAESLIKDACKEQMSLYKTIAQVDSVIQKVYSTRSTRDLINDSTTFEFKRTY